MATEFTVPGTTTPISVREMIGRTYRIYLTNIRTIMMIAVTMYLPAQVIMGIFVNKILSEVIEEENDINDHLSFTLLAFLLFELLGSLFYNIASAAILDVAKNAHAGLTETTYHAAMNTAKSCFLKLLMANFLISIGVSIGLLLLVFPGIYLCICLWLTYPIIVVEKKGIIASMSKSWKLTEGNRCDVFKVYAAYFISYLLLVVAINTVLTVILAPRLVRFVFGYCIPTLSVGPLGMILKSVVYFDLRARKDSLTRDGLVLELQAGKNESAPRSFDLENVNSPSEISGGERVDATLKISATVPSEPLKTPSESIWDNQTASASQKYDNFMS
mmetsp:Transcript_24495/g.28884  ORF Transcript_24495/g.28884 Transcript_24495/m.28884 type:complete len:331 (+) Transcript_24495:128-1120(+)